MKKRVLVVEDHADIRAMMEILLDRYGYEFLEAPDGYKAVEIAMEQRPDAILMDMAMPVLDGLDSVRAIRQQDGFADIPIVAVTAYGDFYKQRAIDAGCTDVLHKPLDFERLRKMLESYLD